MNRLTLLAAGAIAAFTSTQVSATTYLAGTSGTFTAQYAGVYALTASGSAGGLGRNPNGTTTYAGSNGQTISTRMALSAGTVLSASAGRRARR